MITRLKLESQTLFCLALAVFTVPGIAIAKSCNANSAQGRAGLSCGAATQNHPSTTSTMNGHSSGPSGPAPVANQLPTPPARPAQQQVVVGQQGRSFTGYAPPPQTQVLPPQVITGYGPLPTQAVPPLPTQPSVPPQPPQQVVAPPAPQPYQVPPAPQQTVLGQQGPSFTGYAPPPQTQAPPPQVITGYGPPPTQAVPPLPTQPSVPPQPPQQVVAPPAPQPYQVPPAPQQTVVGQQGSSFTGYAPAAPTQPSPPVGGHASVRPKPLPKAVNENAKPIPHEMTDAADSAKGNSGMVANLPGRQDIQKYPEFSDPRSGLSKGCILSGLDRRQVVLPNGVTAYNGTLPNLRTVSSVIADIPSWHPHESGCIASINKK